MNHIAEYAGYLPGLTQHELTWERLSFNGMGQSLDVYAPVLTDAQIRALSKRVRAANRQCHKALRVEEIVDAIDKTIELLLDRTHPLRQKADALLPVVSGFDAEMSRLALSGFLKTFRKPQLLAFLAQDFPNPLVLDVFQPSIKGGHSMAMGAELAVHVWAGNVPGLALWSLISGLLVKSGTIGKVASAEPMLAGWFAQLLVQVEPRLTDCLAVVWWRGGDQAVEPMYFQQADSVLAYGSSTALAHIQKQLPPTTRFLPHGHKLSLALVGKEALDARKAQPTAHQAAFDVMRFDQQGCYSLQMMYVERGAKTSPQDFAGYLGQELAGYAVKYPLHALDMQERQSVSHWQQAHELKVQASPSAHLKTGQGWAVAYSDQPLDLQPSALNRTVQVCAVDSLEQVPDLLASQRPYLQSVGLAAAPNRLFALAQQLGRVGITRISALGQMTVPEAGWHHDGRCSLSDLTQWVDLESSAQTASEAFAPYAD
jgi:hypothetical protein